MLQALSRAACSDRVVDDGGPVARERDRFEWDFYTVASTGDERDPFAYLGFTPPGERGPRPAWDGHDVTITRAEGAFAP